MLLGNLGEINCLLGKPWLSSHEGYCPEEVGSGCMLKWWGDCLTWVEAVEAWGCALEARGIGIE